MTNGDWLAGTFIPIDLLSPHPYARVLTLRADTRCLTNGDAVRATLVDMKDTADSTPHDLPVKANILIVRLTWTPYSGHKGRNLEG